MLGQLSPQTLNQTAGKDGYEVGDPIPGWAEGRLDIAQATAPIVICSPDGSIVCATASASAVLQESGLGAADALPADLWRTLSSVPLGEATEWIPSERTCLGCTRYALGAGGFLVLMRRISDKHAELARRFQRHRLESMGRLVAGIVHDLRSPLASIAYSVELLLRACDSPTEVALCAEEIRESCVRLTELTSSLRDFARAGTRAGAGTETTFRIAESLDRVSRLVGAQLRAGQHVLRWSVEGDDLCARGNRILAEQILVNLVQNAIESGSRPCTMDMRAETSPRSAEGGHPATIRIRVSDDGPGIPRELRQRVFEPFFTTKTQGSGLGLAIARETALQLGGDLALEDSERGASFVLTLPFQSQR